MAREIDTKALKHIDDLDNPYLRHFVRIHNLDDKETLMLGLLMEQTDHMRVALRTRYPVLARDAGVSTSEAYRLVQALHRRRILESRTDGEYIRITFYPITETVDEIRLAYKNARRLDVVEKDLRTVKGRDYLPRADLFDEIYPIMGALIAKKMSEALRSLAQYIDKRLEAATSLRLWRYRARSRISGVPVGELILRDTLPFIVEELFIIEKKSGILLAHHSRKAEGDVDRDLVSGMLTAIRDFIKTSFRKKHDEEVNEISYGDARIMIRAEPYFFAAFVVSGTPDMEFNLEMNRFTLELHRGNRSLVRAFKGDMDSLEPLRGPVRGFVERFSTLPATETGETAPFARLKVAGAILALIFLYLVGAALYHVWNDSRIETALNERLGRTMPAHLYDVSLDVNRGAVTATGVASSEDVVRGLGETLASAPGVKGVDNRVLVVDIERINRFREEMGDIRRRMDAVLLAQTREELEKIVIRFPINVAVIGKEQDFLVKRIHEIIRHHPAVHVDVVAFADNTGSFQINKSLAERRMAAVRGGLIARGMEPARVHMFPFDPALIESDPRMAAHREERGIMIFARMAEGK
ncbi:MAG: hypothetical protein AB2L13_04310 [Spirochaetota bacterium]|jgi:outer membrane protein OmpA-like peptidoglycan-associated protein/DNA-binding cell septation regulator SpoVG